MQIKTFQQYTELAARTASYTPENAIEYTALGLISEIGELAGKLKRPLRGDGELDREGVIAELGDILWYFAMWLRESDLKHELATFTMASIGRNSAPDLDDVLFLAYNAGAMIAIDQSRYLRQGNLDSFAGRFCYCCHDLGLSVAEVATRNIAKLEDRAARGVIKGSGDSR